MQVGVFNLTELTSLWQEVRNNKNIENYCNILQENQPAPKIIENNYQQQCWCIEKKKLILYTLLIL